MSVTGGFIDKLPSSGATRGELRHVVAIKIGREITQRSSSPSGIERVVIAIRGDREAAATPPPSAAASALSSPSEAFYPPTSWRLMLSNQRAYVALAIRFPEIVD